MAQSILSVRMDSETKKQFAAFCNEIGMSVSTAITLFAKQTLREGRIPFTIGLSDSQSTQGAIPRSILAVSTIKDIVAEEARRHVGISAVVLFGSYARGEASPESDIDLRIVYDDDGLTLLDLAAFSEAVRERTGKNIDIVSKADLGDDEFAHTVEREGMVLYERQEQ